MPVDFLNWREKYEIFWKPQVMAMSRMLISPFARSSLERAIRAVDDVVDERTSRVFFEEMGQIIGVQIHHGRKRIAIQLVGEVRFDICLHGGNSRVLGSGCLTALCEQQKTVGNPFS